MISTEIPTSADVTIRPDAPGWRAACARFDLSAEARRFREQLGLPTDRPIVMTGHQAQVWHPGILAKYIAADVAAERFGANAAWVVVDQDTHDPSEVRYPVRAGGKDDALEVRTWRADGAERAWGERFAEVPVGMTPAFGPGAVPEDVQRAAAPHVRAGMMAIRDALARHADEPNAARQVGSALTDLLKGIVRPAPTVYALELCRTDLFKTLVQKMVADPERCLGAYQRAVKAHVDAKVAPLHEGEVPLWAIPEQAGAARKRATLAMLTSGSACRVAPRALLMTAMFRMAGCELFVHGLGGGGVDGAQGYDAITDEWMREWLGVTLPPVAVVTATVRLNFGGAGGDGQSQHAALTPEQIAHARWVAHAAKHRPELLGDAEGAAARARAVEELRALHGKRDEASRRAKRAAYRALHEVLVGVRERRHARLEAIRAEATAAAARRGEAEIIADRTWAFPLYEAGQIAGLRGAIEARLG